MLPIRQRDMLPATRHDHIGGTVWHQIRVAFGPPDGFGEVVSVATGKYVRLDGRPIRVVAPVVLKVLVCL
jgi:hypothetical protein